MRLPRPSRGRSTTPEHTGEGNISAPGPLSLSPAGLSPARTDSSQTALNLRPAGPLPLPGLSPAIPYSAPRPSLPMPSPAFPPPSCGTGPQRGAALPPLLPGWEESDYSIPSCLSAAEARQTPAGECFGPYLMGSAVMSPLLGTPGQAGTELRR